MRGTTCASSLDDLVHVVAEAVVGGVGDHGVGGVFEGDRL